jgi:hypothetical protein
VLLTVIIYAQGLSGELYFDSAKLYQVEEIYREQGGEVELTDLGFTRNYGRIIPQLTFYLNIAVADGVDPYSIKLTNVVIHFVNALLVFLFVSLLLDRTRYRDQGRLLAAAVALLWLVSAINVSGVLYAIQRMNQLATLFSLSGLLLYLKVRGAHVERALSGASLALLLAGTGFLTAIAFACKENGLLVPVFIVLIELYLYPDLPRWLKSRSGLGTTAAAALVLLALLLWFLPGSSLMDYSYRTFTLEERLLTQARILWIYITQLLAPSSATIGLYQDGIPLSTGLFSPVSTFLSLAGLTALVLAAVRYRNHATLGIVAFGVAFFLAGHLLESTIFPLELYYEHRNYLPSVGLYLAFVVAIFGLLRRIPRPYAAGLAVVYLLGVTFAAHSKAQTWSDQAQAYRLALARDYLSPRAASGMAQLHLEAGQVAPAVELLDRVIAGLPHEALRARLQKLYIQCAIGAQPDDRLYVGLPDVSGRELDIEVSQALSNVVSVYAANRCAAIDVHRLIPALQSISQSLREEQRSSWHVDYYVGQLYATYDNGLAARWLEARFLDGEESAGWILKELLASDASVAVAPETRAAIDALVPDGQ